MFVVSTRIVLHSHSISTRPEADTTAGTVRPDHRKKGKLTPVKEFVKNYWIIHNSQLTPVKGSLPKKIVPFSRVLTLRGSAGIKLTLSFFMTYFLLKWSRNGLK